MTCIIAIKDKNNMYIAADKMLSDNSIKDICRIPKIFQPNSSILIGTAGSLRFGQVLEHFIDYNINKYNDELESLILHIIPTMQTVLERYKVDKEEYGEFIICINNRIFEVDSGFGIIEPNRNYTTMGSGGEVAKGSLYTTENTLHTIEERIKIAIEASSYFIKSVSKEYDIIKKEI